jgi:hypothetical protein
VLAAAAAAAAVLTSKQLSAMSLSLSLSLSLGAEMERTQIQRALDLMRELTGRETAGWYRRPMSATAPQSCPQWLYIFGGG